MAAITSKNATGNWSTPTDWVGDVAPGDGDTAIIAEAHEMTVDVNTTIGTSPAATGTDAITNNGVITIATGVTLTYRGDITHANSNDGIVMEAGATLKHDSSQAADPTTASYRLIMGASTSRAYLVCNGTSGNHCVVTSETASSAKYGQISNGGTVCGAIRATYTDFSRFGNGDGADGMIYRFRGAASPENTFFDDCTFDYCGEIEHNSSALSAEVRMARCTWTNTLGDVCLTARGYVSDTSYAVTDNVFDKRVELKGGLGLTVTNNYFGQRLSNTAGAFGDFSDNFIRTTISTGSHADGTVTDCLYYSDHASGNPRGIAWNVTTNLDNQVNGCIFAYDGTDSAGDLNSIQGNMPAGSTLAIRNCHVLPNSDDASSAGCIVSQLGASPYDESFSVEHCTCNDLGANVGESVPGIENYFTSFKSNIVWSNNTGDYKIDDIGGLAVEDLIYSSSADYNAGYNLTAGSNLKGYNGLSFSSGSPGANDVEGVNPQFVDSTRTVATYDIDGLGSATGTAWADATGYTVGDVVSASTTGVWWGKTINYRCIADHTSDDGHATNGKPQDTTTTSWRTNWEYQSLYRLREDTDRIPLLVTWIKAGFAPTDLDYRNAGHDGVTIGAEEGVWTPPQTSVAPFAGPFSSSIA